MPCSAGQMTFLLQLMLGRQQWVAVVFVRTGFDDSSCESTQYFVASWHIFSNYRCRLGLAIPGKYYHCAGSLLVLNLSFVRAVLVALECEINVSRYYVASQSVKRTHKISTYIKINNISVWISHLPLYYRPPSAVHLFLGYNIVIRWRLPRCDTGGGRRSTTGRQRLAHERKQEQNVKRGRKRHRFVATTAHSSARRPPSQAPKSIKSGKSASLLEATYDEKTISQSTFARPGAT